MVAKRSSELPAAERGRPLGIIANPVSGRDVRRLAARAAMTTPQDKRNQVARAVIGAVAAGTDHVLVMKEPFRVSTSAVENLRIDARIEVIDVGARLEPSDTERAAEAMRKAGCGAVLVLGGDGTNRTVTRVWRDAPLLPVSTGTNNVFPTMIEATLAGAAAGLVASGRVQLGEVAPRAKLIELEIAGEADDLALIDAVMLVDDHVGNRLPFDPARLRSVLLTRAEPSAIGISPIGGLLARARASDDFGVLVECTAPDGGGRPLLVPISQGLYRTVHVGAWRTAELGEVIEIRGPCVLAMDGDRERRLRAGQTARLRVVRSGPHVIDAEHVLRLASERGLFLDRPAWHDAYDGS